MTGRYATVATLFKAAGVSTAYMYRIEKDDAELAAHIRSLLEKICTRRAPAAKGLRARVLAMQGAYSDLRGIENALGCDASLLGGLRYRHPAVREHLDAMIHNGASRGPRTATDESPSL